MGSHGADQGVVNWWRDHQPNLDFVKSGLESPPGHDPVIAKQGHHDAAGGCVAGHRECGGDWHVGDCFQHPEEHIPELAHLFPVKRQQLWYIETRGKHTWQA